MPSASAPDADHETSEHPSKATSNGASHPETTKPITIMLPDDVLKKLKVVAIVRETSVSELVAEAAAGVVKRELKKALGKLDT